MPLKPEVENLIKEYTPAAQAEARALYEKFPDMQDAVVKQAKSEADYMRAIQKAQADAKDAAEQKKKNIDWFRDSEKEYNAAMAQTKALETELEKLKTAQKTIGSPEASSDLLKEITAIRDEIKKRDDALKDLKDTTQKQIDNAGLFVVDIEQSADNYAREFGKPLDRRSLVKHMQDSGTWDVTKAYDALVANDRQAAAVAKAVKEAEEKRDQEWQAKVSAGQLPYANGGQPPEKGPVQRFINKETGVPDNMPADGSGRIAALAAQELRTEGKF